MTDRLLDRLHTLPVWFLVAMVLSGCSKPVERGQVSGTLTVKGQPLANVLVTLVPETSGSGVFPSLAVTDSSGRFDVRTQDQQSGAVVGVHRVIIEDLGVYAAPRSPDGTLLAPPAARFAAAYSDLLQTPLRCEVKPGAQTVNFELLPP